MELNTKEINTLKKYKMAVPTNDTDIIELNDKFMSACKNANVHVTSYNLYRYPISGTKVVSIQGDIVVDGQPVTSVKINVPSPYISNIRDGEALDKLIGTYIADVHPLYAKRVSQRIVIISDLLRCHKVKDNGKLLKMSVYSTDDKKQDFALSRSSSVRAMNKLLPIDDSYID